ncbi:MAG: HAMP domain-containing sensor histidine kinase [Candidatus Margulisiibacteriota bacterium]
MGIIIAILVVGLLVLSRQYAKTKFHLQSQGVALTQNLARNAEPFLVDYDKDQLNQFLTVMLDNPLVLFTGVISTQLGKPKIDVLQKQSNIDLKFVTNVIRKSKYNNISESLTSDVLYSKKHIIYCISPIFSQFVFPDDETTLLYNYPRYHGIIGYSVIAYKMPLKHIFSVNLIWLISLFLLVSISLGFVLGRWITNSLFGRLKLIYRAIEAYSFGDKFIIKDEKNDEISEIANAINGLASLINIQIDKITQTNNALKTKVNDHLDEISFLNEKLQLFSLNQRSYVAHYVQEVTALIELLADPKISIELTQLIINHILSTLRQLIQLLQDNQGFSKITQIDNVNIYETIISYKPLFAFMAEKYGNTFKMSVPKNVQMETSRIYFFQALIQLILNASRYTSNGRIELNCKIAGGQLIFSITDTGVGIDQDRINKILTSLDKDDMSLVDAFSTVGLGLVLVHRFCRNMQAKLICMSTKGGGTSIEIIHPIKSSVKIEQLNKLVLISQNQIQLKSLQSVIQVIPNWHADIVNSVSMYQLGQPRIFLVDLDHLDNPLQELDAIFTKYKNSKLILFSNQKFIFLSAAIPEANLFKGDLINTLMPKGLKGILIQGATSEVELALKNNYSEFQFFNKFSYNQTIGLRIVNEAHFKLETKEPILLYFQSIKTIMDLIEERGQDMYDIPKLNLFLT